MPSYEYGYALASILDYADVSISEVDDGEHLPFMHVEATARMTGRLVVVEAPTLSDALDGIHENFEDNEYLLFQLQDQYGLTADDLARLTDLTAVKPGLPLMPQPQPQLLAAQPFLLRDRDSNTMYLAAPIGPADAFPVVERADEDEDAEPLDYADLL